LLLPAVAQTDVTPPFRPQPWSPRTRRRTAHPSPRTIAAAQAVCALALPNHRARRLREPPHLELELKERSPRDPTPIELEVYGVVSAARAVGAPGVRMTIAEVAAKIGRSPRSVQYALEGLGEHRLACEGPCARPGHHERRYAKGPRTGHVDRLPKCRGCADPCPAGCTRHLERVRVVHQFIPLAWTDEYAPAGARATFKRRQCASVMLLGTVARRIERDGCSSRPPPTSRPTESPSAFAPQREGRISHSGRSAKHSKNWGARGEESPPATPIRPAAAGLGGDADVTRSVTRDAERTGSGGRGLLDACLPDMRDALGAAWAALEAREATAPADPPREKRARAPAPIALERVGRPGGDA